jgi:hypothetical protein
MAPPMVGSNSGEKIEINFATAFSGSAKNTNFLVVTFFEAFV